MRKIASIVLSILIIATLSMTFVQQVRADHYANVYWVTDPSEKGVVIDPPLNQTKAFIGSLGTSFNATFAVFNNDTAAIAHGALPHADDIVNVRVVLPRNESGYVYFRFAQGWTLEEGGNASVIGWHADPTEFDPRGWPGTVIFSGLPNGTKLSFGDTYWFRMNFIESPQSCHYKFTVYTEDQGLPYTGHPKTEIHDLDLIIDNVKPEISTTISNNDTIYGQLENHCGNNFFWLNFTTDDLVSSGHETGILNYTVYFDSQYFDSETLTYNSTHNVSPNYLSKMGRFDVYYYRAKVSTLDGWDLYSGVHNFTITVFDKVTNMQTTGVINFTYVPPDQPFVLSPSTGNAALSTYVASANNASGLVTSVQAIYKSKTLGTMINASGYNFGTSKVLRITVYIPTYISYFARYGTYEVLVYNGTTQADGTFNVQFVFPEAPAGKYVVKAQTTTMWCAVYFVVTSEVIYKPDEVIGPAPIEVMATGFTAQNNSYVRPSWLFIVPDALQGVNTQIDHWWFIDGNGTLVNWLNTQTVGVENVSTTLNWPWMEPGTYTVELKHINGDWWNGTGMNWVYKQCFVGGNTITVKETLSLLIDINAILIDLNAKLDYLKPIIERVDGTVVTINTTAGRIEATINQLSPVITSINGTVVTINTVVGQINTTMATVGPQLVEIGPRVVRIETSVGTGLSGKVDSIQGNVTTIKTGVGDIQTQIPSLTTPIYIAVVFSIIAAIAAIACAFLVFRKIA
jgi:hypothetical protein